ncbi:SH3-like domain-containing protein [Roseomonas sp. CCTCC AB2023176]|uniref:SH3-like domain-containing protein n=1 Tax=Roseomonas sp. CCTCC AB2023176 TaxID=3342640 RepID=UPI0035D7FEB4
MTGPAGNVAPRAVAGGDAPKPAIPGTPAPRFAPGDAVRVRDDWPEARGPAHVRTPHYLRGRVGRVAATLGAYPDPSDLAFARPAPRVVLYHVAFPRAAAFPGQGDDELLVELYETWLTPGQEDA